jgi:hypothetical protein
LGIQGDDRRRRSLFFTLTTNRPSPGISLINSPENKMTISREKIVTRYTTDKRSDRGQAEGRLCAVAHRAVLRAEAAPPAPAQHPSGPSDTDLPSPSTTETAHSEWLLRVTFSSTLLKAAFAAFRIEEMVQAISLAIAVGLAMVHLVAGKLRFLDGTPRSIWLSGAGGVSVAYVFVHVLPDLANAQEKFWERRTGWVADIELHSWLIAVTGLAVFYGLERLVKQHQRRTEPTQSGSAAAGVFWIHTVSFAAYNTLFGYLLLHREKSGLVSLTKYGIAIALHFLVNDYGLRQDHKEKYDSIVRWVLALAIMSGWVLGTLLTVDEMGTAALFAFLAGGIVLNVMKEELPEERESRFWAFACGLAAYTAALLAT